MPICFFDTSALAKYYHEEIGTQHVISLIDTPDNRIYISRLALTEWHSAFTRKVRIGTLPISNFQIAKQTFYSDLRNRRLIIIVCADIPFCQIARQEGLPVLNPESP